MIQKKKVSIKCAAGVKDGKIVTNVPENQVPKENNQSNFEGEYSYQYGDKNQIEILIGEKWMVFETKEVEKFQIKVYDKFSKSQSLSNIIKIIDKNENDKYDYSIYGYGVNVNIVIGGEETSLKQALEENKITMEDILEQANKDIPEPVIYKDGGSKEYHYDLYTIIKLNGLNGNKDVYICMPNTTLNTIMTTNKIID